MKFTQLLLVLSFGLITEGTLMCAAAQSKVKQDHYQILGVARDASKEEIRQAWLTLHQQLIQKNKGGSPAESLTSIHSEKVERDKLNTAYKILRDPDQRAAYDRGGDAEVARINGEADAQPKQQAQPKHDAHAPHNIHQGNNAGADYVIDQNTAAGAANFSAFWSRTLRADTRLLGRAQEHFSNKNLEALRNANRGKPLILVLVPANGLANDTFGLANIHVYEAHRFNQYIATDRDTPFQEGPGGETLRELWINPLTGQPETAETCYIILEPGANRFTYLCSLSDLAQPSFAGETLRDRFQQASNGALNYEASMPNIACAKIAIPGIPIALPATLKPATSAYVKAFIISALVGLAHGVVNNWLGRSAHVDNTSFLHAPWREWGTAMLFSSIQGTLTERIVGEKFFARLLGSGHLYGFGTLTSGLGSAAQMLGEVIPLSKNYTGYRTVAPNFGSVATVISGLAWAIAE
jgi:curved DNA-binding protein CbpA